MKCIFLLSYDAEAAADIHPQLIAFVDALKGVESWSQPYPGLILLTGQQGSVIELGERVGKFFNGGIGYWLATVVKGENMVLLPEQTWEWLDESETGHLAKHEEHN